MVLDDLNEFVRRKPQYQVIPAVLFSSNLSGLALVYHLLFYFGHRFRLGGSYAYHFFYLYSKPMWLIDPRSFEALKHSPQSQISWGPGLAIAMKLVLKQLVNLPVLWTSKFLYSSPRRRLWTQHRKPTKAISLDFLCQLPNPIRSHDSAYYACRRHGIGHRPAHKILSRRRQCFILLKAVRLYLHKFDHTSEVAKLARKSLPKAALWFPRLMKRARADMDAYVRRWEGAWSVTFLIAYLILVPMLASLDGLSERTQLLAINDMD